jgi:linoleate 10R-lipoxygenase
MPSLGMAGSPYARSVPSQRCLPQIALPPSDLVFDALLKRDKFVEHPGGISSLFFAFADIIIHNIFNTDASVKGWTTNSASSYLDLSPLYGSSQEAVNSVRRFDGTGRLHDDVFADPRLINMPPAVCALLILFNRNHNVSLRLPCPLLYFCFIVFKVCGGKNSFHQREWELKESSAHRFAYS